MSARAGRIGAAMFLGAAVLTLVATLQNLFVAETAQGEARQRFVITSWDMRTEAEDPSVTGPESGPLNGVPLLIAAALLFAAAMLGMRAVTRRPSRLWSLAAVVAATFLAGTVATIGAQELWWLDILDIPESTGGETQATVSVGPGYWMLVLSAALAVAAAVPAWRQNRPAPERVEPDTPTLGFPAVRRLPDVPPDDPVA